MAKAASWSITDACLLYTSDAADEEDSGIPSVEVKFVDIGKKTSGEGGYLDRN